MAINITLIATGVGLLGSLVGGVYVAEDRYAHTKDLTAIKTELITTQKQLPKTYTLVRDFYTFQLRSESRWIQRDIDRSNEFLTRMRRNKKNLTPNQRLSVRDAEQRLGRLLKQQQLIDSSLQQFQAPSR